MRGPGGYATRTGSARTPSPRSAPSRPPASELGARGSSGHREGPARRGRSLAWSRSSNPPVCAVRSSTVHYYARQKAVVVRRTVPGPGSERGNHMPKPTIVLVHGAWADGSSWNAVSTELQGQGFTVLTPPNRLRGVAGDAAYVASFLAQRTTGPVVLVGHSYGGVVITNAGTGGGDVRALVYVDAFVPDEGETVFQILGGSGSALDVPDPTTVLDLVGYPGRPEGDAEA